VLRRVLSTGWAVLLLLPDGLARLGLVDRERARETFELALPAMTSGAIWMILRFADFFMVSLALTDAAVAAMQLAFQYYLVGFAVAMAVASGTMSLVARFKGAAEHENADLAVKQGIWLALLLSLPLIMVSWFFAEPLIGLFTQDSAVVRFGSTYLRIVMLGLLFRFGSLVGARGLEAAGNTTTPMYVSFLVIPLNFVLNAVLIFGLGPFPELGIAGAAWGTVLTSVVTLAIYLPIFLSGSFALRLVPGGRQWDTATAAEIVRIGIPLTGRQMANTVGNFPFLAILAVLGTPIVAAYAIGLQIMRIAMIPGYGYSTASSAMVGQKLGDGDADAARSYGWQTVRLGVATQVLIGAGMVLLARPLVAAFDTEAMELSIMFTRALAVGVVGNSIAMALQGGLRGAGDTTWPMYGAVLGMALRIALAALALPAGYLIAVGPVGLTPGLELGIWVVLVAVIVDRYVRAAVNAIRFHGGKWQAVAEGSASRTGLASNPPDGD